MANKKRPDYNGYPTNLPDTVFGDFDSEAEDARQAQAEPTGNLCWDVYKIHPGLPLKTKIEQLVTLWELDAEEIAQILDAQISDVKDAIVRLRQMWSDLGEGLNEEDAKIARGKLIREYLRYKAELEALPDVSADGKIITMKLKLSEQIARLRGVEAVSKPNPEDVPAANTIDRVKEAFAALTPEKIEALSKALNKD